MSLVGNEGIAGSPVWQKVNPDKIRNNPSNSYLNHGIRKEAIIKEKPMSLFAPAGSTMTIKSLSPLRIDGWPFKSVGRGTPLLLNIPPNQDGKFADADVAV